ncbi:transporter [Rhodoblastus acidophilus]|uniref:transporter n=1 Tax=Rhodoblastus acidophilus TaxID=1074 RepID=UPI001473CFEB|nr:transporter [Rhodoblastus acidophilus]
MGLRHRQALDHAQSADCARPSACDHHARDAAQRRGIQSEAGAVGYASWDLDQPYVGYAKQSQLVLGGLVGYDFGAVDVAFKLTRTVAETN